jgi:Fe2+ or Zn2+ uptake regulation protein
MSPEDFFRSQKKYRMSHQRQVILEEILKVNTHPTADEVYEMVRKRLPRISMGTVYRNLEILSTAGLIRRIGPVTSQMRFDGNTKNHYHIRCIRCGTVGDAPVEPMDNIENAIRRKSEYTIIGHTVEFIGVCPMCREKEGLSQKEARETGETR